jgi:hypothetical protein
MSLATQLARGTLALPMLLAFAGLGLFANERVEAEPVSALQAQVQATRFEQLRQFRQVEHAAALERLAVAQARAAATLPAIGQQLSKLCSARGARNHVLVLAQAPADLGTLAVRFNSACRA